MTDGAHRLGNRLRCNHQELRIPLSWCGRRKNGSQIRKSLSKESSAELLHVIAVGRCTWGHFMLLYSSAGQAITSTSLWHISGSSERENLLFSRSSRHTHTHCWNHIFSYIDIPNYYALSLELERTESNSASLLGSRGLEVDVQDTNVGDQEVDSSV